MIVSRDEHSHSVGDCIWYNNFQLDMWRLMNSFPSVKFSFSNLILQKLYQKLFCIEQETIIIDNIKFIVILSGKDHREIYIVLL